MKKSGRRATIVRPRCAHNTERGMTLIEVLIALSIIAAVAVIFLAGMSTSSKAAIVNQHQVIGENLAKSQLEYIKRQPYDAISPIEYAQLDPGQIPSAYAIQIVAVPMNPRGDSEMNDDGLQKITITITNNGETVFTLEGYKCFTGQ